MARPEPGSRGRVLLVEDDVLNQIVAVGILGRLGYHADVAENGREAVAAVERSAYRAVLMDCRMPEMDGYQATTEIRRREGTAGHVPVIAMTASATQADRDAAWRPAWTTSSPSRCWWTTSRRCCPAGSRPGSRPRRPPWSRPGRCSTTGASTRSGSWTTARGRAYAPGDPTSLDELLEQADAALYRVKSAGRNRVALFEDDLKVAG